MIYLDHAAATPVDSAVLAAMLPHFSDEFYNPSATYARAQQARRTLEGARAQAAGVLGSRRDGSLQVDLRIVNALRASRSLVRRRVVKGVSSGGLLSQGMRIVVVRVWVPRGGG